VTSLKKYDLTGKMVGQIEIADSLLECVANSQMIKDYIVALRANKRQWSRKLQRSFHGSTSYGR
jgi:large subunit ribosomal protein L4